MRVQNRVLTKKRDRRVLGWMGHSVIWGQWGVYDLSMVWWYEGAVPFISYKDQHHSLELDASCIREPVSLMRKRSGVDYVQRSGTSSEVKGLAAEVERLAVEVEELTAEIGNDSCRGREPS